MTDQRRLSPVSQPTLHSSPVSSLDLDFIGSPKFPSQPWDLLSPGDNTFVYDWNSSPSLSMAQYGRTYLPAVYQVGLPVTIFLETSLRKQVDTIAKMSNPAIGDCLDCRPSPTHCPSNKVRTT